MGATSNIEWTDATWNIAVGCSKVDADCKYCYMFRDSMSDTRYEAGVVKRTKTVFTLPLRLKQPSRVFTSSLTDFFHVECDSFRDQAWDIIRRCPQHTFQILTKRPERIRETLPSFYPEIAGRCWLGTSVGHQGAAHRLDHLAKLQDVGSLLWLSAEPLHTALDISAYIHFLGWVVIGGESGNESGKYRYRPCELGWMGALAQICKDNGVPYFLKQLGTHLAKAFPHTDRHGRVLPVGLLDAYGTDGLHRQFPGNTQ